MLVGKPITDDGKRRKTTEKMASIGNHPNIEDIYIYNMYIYIYFTHLLMRFPCFSIRQGLLFMKLGFVPPVENPLKIARSSSDIFPITKMVSSLSKFPGKGRGRGCEAWVWSSRYVNPWGTTRKSSINGGVSMSTRYCNYWRQFDLYFLGRLEILTRFYRSGFSQTHMNLALCNSWFVATRPYTLWELGTIDTTFEKFCHGFALKVCLWIIHHSWW